jgi:cell division protein FtsI/penicillin-binding protein 2
MKKESFQFRIRVVMFFIISIALVILSKLFFVQILNRNLYLERADRQYITPASNVFNRGSIFFSKKDGSLTSGATISSGFKIQIIPKNVIDEEDTYNKLAPYLVMDYDTFLSKISKKDNSYKEIANQLTQEQVREIRKKYNYIEYSYDKLSREYGVTRSTIQKIIKNKTWKEEETEDVNG